MTKSRQHSNTSNRLSVANATELATKTGTREGELILQENTDGIIKRINDGTKQ